MLQNEWKVRSQVSTMVNGRTFVKISRKVYSTAAYSMAEYSTAYITAKYSTAEYSTVEYSTAMYSTRFKIIDTGLVTDRRNEAIHPRHFLQGAHFSQSANAKFDRQSKTPEGHVG